VEALGNDAAEYGHVLENLDLLGHVFEDSYVHAILVGDLHEQADLFLNHFAG